MRGRPRSCTCGECLKCLRADYMRQWYQSKTPEERRAMYARRNKEVAQRSDKKRQHTEARKASWAEYQKRRRARYPEKEAARRAVSYALLTGKLTKQPCAICGTTQQVHAHHDDYSKQIEVVWLCGPHHRERHHPYE